ncbi:PREDICTED: pentatricopeptide repeat-containing protein At1g71490 isoform X1 [Nelumbo nucifera]|uniref:Pentatricopeptide repeat-containing protein At1g71490 isoform X1 n=2 Tax=Nelumbo nucifera TaxID=4432 RepID=A0A1U7ZCT3_NELNU|nr:PREDICTED: pentatricopeptide repeat-containing protein At1g71490 isoform X1 [Nelumbo nucifera]XP_010245709.1 PREDICTED: pentatricopeptide repeat-containing protein At1g71490 isoform X1 [Nelumbo nucifera]XP_010245710.1 PREDICTED: pentatricopeptide repeat-containing protein At1g71490 isoform X1 [Nelumbo nucifera]XP_010245712.1 PREDICTED: pentatricopeptide repeat-containing protein At1g71490 isoform X1 [Nelumbo nucifera]XP_010245713.1 PREDICTED: pentatricopeptide repeat-containing protein At1g7
MKNIAVVDVNLNESVTLMSSSPILWRSLSQSHIQRFIPKTWRLDIHKNHQMACYVINESVTDSSGSCMEGYSSREGSLIDSLQSSLKTFTSQGHLSRAFKTFSLLQLHAASSRDIIIEPLSSLLLCCTSLKSLQEGKQLHAHIISLGLEQHLLLVPKLVTFYSSFDYLIEAHAITENSNILHALPWNLLIAAYVRNGLSKEALLAYKQMLCKGIRADNFTYPSILKACAEESDLGFGREIHRSIDDSGLEWSLFVQNALISMYAKCGEIGVARALFDKMPEKDVVSWNTIIFGYASKRMWQEAFDLFERMQIECSEVNIVTCNTIAGGRLQIHDYKGALDLISQMRSRCACLDSVTVVIGLGACSRGGFLTIGREIHGFAVRSCNDRVETVRNALITMYSRCKDLKHAYILFQLIEFKSLITWNSMISGFTSSDRSEEAAFIFRELLSTGVEPNYVTIACILPLCARVANLQHGKELHCYITKRGGFEDYLLVWNSLVDMYSKSGKILEAQRVFNLMNKRDEVTYTSLIAGYGIQGEGQVALKLFEEMDKLMIKPDHITMIAILSACSHSGLVSEGQMLFEKMTSLYGIHPRFEHFACMVDLFGRAGLLRKAEEVIKMMPFRPSPAMWATLIGACRIHGNVEVGEWAAEKLLEMKPENSGYYVLIANMYAAAGCWSKLAKVRTFMRDLGVRKAPGCAWINVGSGFYPFVVGDRSSPHAQDIYLLLEGLTKLMQEVGYVPCDELGLNADDFEE